jgi:MYXO-CTERM domain-containing protein
MVEGFWAPPAGSVLWIEQLSATPGLLSYSGGTMMNQGSFAPIFGTAGSSSRIQWNGAMLHNWYAATSAGDYSATYRIYFGDAQGNATDGFQAGEVTLNWTAVPAPGAAGALGLAGLLATRRRR